MKRLGLVLGLLGALLATVPAQAEGRIDAIGTPANAIFEVAGISNSGQVGGSRTIAPGDGLIAEAWRWSLGAPEITLLPTFGGRQAMVRAVNESGDCVGWADNGGLVDKPAYWPISGGISNLSAGRYSYNLTGLNNASAPTISAHVSVRGTGQVPYCYRGGKWLALPTLGSSGEAHDVNDSNVIVGYCRAADGTDHVVRWVPTNKGFQIQDLTALRGIQFRGRVLVNNAGTLVSGDQVLAVDGALISIPAPAGSDANRVVVTALSENGRIVGEYRVPVDPERPEAAFRSYPLYFNGATSEDVNTLLPPASGWVLTSATGVNDAGQIVGMGKLADQRRAYVLTP